MARMKPPHVPDAPPPVLSEDELKRLLATCERGSRFEDRRDAALIRVFIHTGARRAEVANLRYIPADETVGTGALCHRPSAAGTSAIRRAIRAASQV